MKEIRDVMLSVRVTETDMENLRTLAKLHECTVSQYVRSTVEEAISRTRSYMRFICDKCKNELHAECGGSTWCDCQHRKPKK
jgi:hypothetical protein